MNILIVHFCDLVITRVLAHKPESVGCIAYVDCWKGLLFSGTSSSSLSGY